MMVYSEEYRWSGEITKNVEWRRALKSGGKKGKDYFHLIWTDWVWSYTKTLFILGVS